MYTAYCMKHICVSILKCSLILKCFQGIKSTLLEMSTTTFTDPDRYCCVQIRDGQDTNSARRNTQLTVLEIHSFWAVAANWHDTPPRISTAYIWKHCIKATYKIYGENIFSNVLLFVVVNNLKYNSSVSFMVSSLTIVSMQNERSRNMIW